MIHAVSEVDPERKFTLKWQLFKKAGDNIPLAQSSFLTAYEIASKYGYQTTASVFDEESLNYLMKFDIPFIKIACVSELYPLIGLIPRRFSVIASIEHEYAFVGYPGIIKLACIRRYPADASEYLDNFKKALYKGISDHTTNWNLFRKYSPEIYECHFCIRHNNTDPDSSAYSRTPEDLKQIYDLI
jgi:sialic acid synthase SpsE